MFKFNAVCELFAIETRVSKKNNNTYTVFTLLAENGKTVDIMYNGEALNFAGLNLRECYDFTFQIEVGRYNKIVITNISK